MTGTATVLRADARALPLADASVDLVVTSPPYFALRSYTDGGEHYQNQIGAEATPAEYIANLIDCTREWMRVLKPSGSIFVNLGDKYYAGRTGGHAGGKSRLGERAHGGETVKVMNSFIHPTWQPKSLMYLPERYRIAATDELGLIGRAVLVWSKPNGLPESVTDRVRRSHEDWVHLTKQPRYFSAVDEIREAHSEPGGRPAYGRQRPPAPGGNRGLHVGRGTHADHRDMGQSPLGKLPGSVWEIPTEPLTVPDHLGVDHFAAFPTEWPRRIILGWSPSGICVDCGEGRRPVVERERVQTRKGTDAIRGGNDGSVIPMSGGAGFGQRAETAAAITGEACACPDTSAPTRSAVVLDPFGGTGTTALVAKALGRHGITSDRSADYCRLAKWRTTDPGQLAKAMRVTKPPAQLDGQGDLFTDLAKEAS